MVIGSTRRASRAVDSLFERFWREDPERLGHTQTFEGKATTMDRMGSKGPGTHIIADASKYPFGSRLVRRVYVERVEHGLDLSGEITESALEGDNLIGSIVGNVALAMPPGSVLVNEWHPYVRLLGAGFTPEQLQRFVRLNPFTGFIRFDAAMAAAASLAENSEVRGPTPAIIAEASSLQPLLRQLLGFYIQRGMGSAEQIRRRLREEIFLIQEILVKKIKLVLRDTPGFDFDGFTAMAADFAWVTQLHPAPPGSICTVPTSKGPFTGRVFDFGTLITHTLLNFLLSDVAVHQNRGQVITFMESAGFTNVRVKRGKSSANGRENVWLVEATRSGDGVTGSPAGAAASASAAACDAAAAGAASSCGEDGAKGDDTKKDGEGR